MMRALALALALVTLSACGASTVQVQTTTITASAIALDASGDVIEAAAYQEASHCADVPCVDALRPRWAPVDSALAAARAALVAWLASLSAVAGSTGLSDAAASYLAAWRALVEAASQRGVTLPAL